MFLIVSRFLTPKGFGGLTVFPFVIVRKKEHAADLVFLNHERIHIKQQLELLVLPFFVWYFVEFLFRLVQYKNRNDAYRNIGFEKEAYANENNKDYLMSRRFWSFWNYL